MYYIQTFQFCQKCYELSMDKNGEPLLSIGRLLGPAINASGYPYAISEVANLDMEVNV